MLFVYFVHSWDNNGNNDKTPTRPWICTTVSETVVPDSKTIKVHVLYFQMQVGQLTRMDCINTNKLITLSHHEAGTRVQNTNKTEVPLSEQYIYISLA